MKLNHTIGIKKRLDEGKLRRIRTKAGSLKKVFDTDEKELELPLDIANPTEELGGSTLKTVDIFNPDYEKDDEREKQDTRREIKNLKNKFTDMIKDESRIYSSKHGFQEIVYRSKVFWVLLGEELFH